MVFTEESLRERLEEHRLPVWTAAEFQERMEGFESYFLGEGYSGVSYLMTKGKCGVVVKDMKYNDVVLLEQEILSLTHVYGMPGTQQITGMCIEDDQFSIVSRYAGPTLG